MTRKLFKAGNSVVVSLPKDALQFLGLAEGAEVELNLDREQRQLIIKPADETVLAGVDETYARQVAEFIEKYRVALEALAR